MINPMEMTGRRILVTGASSGLGRATAVLLSKLGCNLVLVARRRDQLEITRQLLDGTDHHIIERDFGGELDLIPKWLKQTTELTGTLNGLVHCAGISSLLPLRVLSEAKLQETMNVNFVSGLMLVKGFRQRGVSAGNSSVVLIGSITGLIGQPGLSAYSASKGAIFAITRSLALELASEGIRVNAIAPGLVRTDMAKQSEEGMPSENFSELEKNHPLGLGQPDDVANAVVYLLSDTGRWITGSTLVVDGGYTIR